MAAVRAHEASPFICYDVFLSFRGEDTRKTFTDHLYRALVQQGFRTFRDDDETEKGEYLKSELEKAICQSKISIIVISKDYASSRWCLDELVMILEQRRNSRHVVLPVFYNVDPSQVRKQTGRTAEAFARYEEQFVAEIDYEVKTKLMEKIKGWRTALTEVADLIGLDLRNQVDGHEAMFIQKIVAVIGDKLRHTTLVVAPYEIGIDYRAKDINMWLQDGSTDVSLRAICGMGGIGKTTIAKFVYNQNSKSFDSSSFLANIREVSEQPNGLLCLQRQLLSDISRRKHGKIHNVDEGLAKIKSLVCSKRVLLVLDDVEEADQLYVIFGRQDWLFPGSKVIITTRHERLLKPHHIYKVQKLGEDESIKLFSLHAFGEDGPLETCTEYTKRAVRICEGLPLALQVVGSSLSGKSQDEWVSELEKLEAIPHSQIVRKLKISYDSLQDDYDKRLFLDIACFFVGTNKDYTIKILEKWDLHAKNRIQNLIDRGLLIDQGNLLGMHRLIQDIGREIIHQESDEAGERSRLWHHWDAFNVLKNETGTKTVEGLTLDMRMLKEASNHAKKQRYEEFIDISTLSKHVSSLKRGCFSFISGKSISKTLTSFNDVCLRTDAFKSMIKLRLLKLHYVQITGSYENFPKSLAWLSWHGFPLESIPVELLLENLVALDLHHSRLELVWKETPFLESLKILDLSYSEWLERTPNFLGLPKLERLILKGCVSLVEICDSIVDLEMLDLLDLEDCKTLTKLPRNIGKLGSLKTLVISGCNIGELPSEMRNMKSLEVLNADGIVINPLNNSSDEVNWWQPIVWSMVSTPMKGPETLWASLPCSLKSLSMSSCNISDDSFPENFGNLPLLSFLDLSKNPFCRLPNCITSLSGLLFLHINECHRLQSLELNGLPDKSGWIEARNCTSLEKITSLDVSYYLNLHGCSKLVEIEDYFEKESIGKFDDKEIMNYLDIPKFTENDKLVRYASYFQGMFEFGIFSIYVPSGAVPLFSSKTIAGPSICFTVPLLPARKIQCLNVCCIYGSTGNGDVAAKGPRVTTLAQFNRRAYCVLVKIENKTKDLTWIYRPKYFQFANDKDWEWLSRWRFGNHLEAGDEITLTFDGENKYEVKECGFEIVYAPGQEEKNGRTTTIEKSRHDFPAFRLSTGEYFLCRLFKQFPDEDYWFPKDHKQLH